MPKEPRQIVMNEDDIIKNGDFREAFRRVLALMRESKNQNKEAIERLQNAFNSLIARIEKEHSISLSDLRGKVDHVFVGEQLDAIKKEHDGRIVSIDDKLRFVDERVAGLRHGKTPIKNIDYFDGGRGIDGRKIKPEEIANKLEILKGDARLDASAIKGLELIIKDVKGLLARPIGVGTSSRDLISEIDISSQLDGSTRTFNIAAIWKILTVDLSSFPHTLRKGTDFTNTPITITFTNEVSDEALSAGQTCILTVVNA